MSYLRSPSSLYVLYIGFSKYSLPHQPIPDNFSATIGSTTAAKVCCAFLMTKGKIVLFLFLIPDFLFLIFFSCFLALFSINIYLQQQRPHTLFLHHQPHLFLRA